MRRGTAHSIWLVALGLLVALAAAACWGSRSGEARAAEPPEAPSIRALDPPAAAGSFAPSLAAGRGELLLTWWERLEAPSGERRHRLMFARFTDGWSEPAVVVEGRDFFANWADFPSVIREPSGSLLVHWLEKTAEETFAYSIYLARSEDEGTTWQGLGRLNDDATHTEHGFVSFVTEGEGVRAYWLDGRRMAAGGPMTVRSSQITDRAGPSELLDDRVCECCPTDAVATPEGSLVVYRDRSADETRDIFAVRRFAEGWSQPEPVTADGWRIPGCPVNGPAVDHRDGATAVAWFTGAGGAPAVSMRFLEEGADSEPLLIDDRRPLGRVGLALDEDGSAVVSWLAVAEDDAEVTLRRGTSAGGLGEALVVGRTSGSRASGMPQLERIGERLYVAWVEVFEGVESRIRLREVPAELVPRV